MGRKPTQKSRRGRPRWREGFEEDLAYGLSERGWTQREIFELLNYARGLLAKDLLEDVIGAKGSSPYYRAVRDRIDAGRARANAASPRYKKLLQKDLAAARRLARALMGQRQTNNTTAAARIFTEPKRGRGPAATRSRRASH